MHKVLVKRVLLEEYVHSLPHTQVQGYDLIVGLTTLLLK